MELTCYFCTPKLKPSLLMMLEHPILAIGYHLLDDMSNACTLWYLLREKQAKLYYTDYNLMAVAFVP